MKTRFSFLFFLSLLLLFPLSSLKAQEKLYIELFTSPSCPHCLAEKQYLENLKKDYSQIEIKEYNFSQNIELISDYYSKYNVPQNKQGLIPATFIEDQFFIGFDNNTKKEILNKIKNQELDLNTKTIKIPLWGEQDISQFSLPVLAVILGVVDGFNVCSLGALVIILGLVMVLKSRKKILVLGGLFILITGLIYGLLIFMWQQLFLILSPYIKSMEIFIGVLSIIGGTYLAREYFKSKKQGATCSSNGIISKLSPKVEKIFSKKKNILILSTVVILFAIIITIVEFPCSALLPVLFAGILVEANISFPLTILYLSIFIFFYLLDEIIIFLIAFFTMRIKIVSPKFINLFTLIASLIFLFLGSFYLIRALI